MSKQDEAFDKWKDEYARANHYRTIGQGLPAARAAWDASHEYDVAELLEAYRTLVSAYNHGFDKIPGGIAARDKIKELEAGR